MNDLFGEYAFDRFWGLYPRKLDRKKAELQWNRLTIGEKALALSAIPKHVQAWKTQGTEKEYIIFAERWLRNQRFLDEVEIGPEMPQCWWNQSGFRDSNAPQCAEQAVKEHDGQFYCAAHCQRLGLKVVRG